MCLLTILHYSSFPWGWFFPLDVSILISLYWDLSKFSYWVFLISIVARAYNCLMYAHPALALSAGQYEVMILVLVLFPSRSNIHDQRTRFLNSWTFPIALYDTLSTAMIAMPPLWNGLPDMVTLLYILLILIIFNHLSVLLNIFSFMIKFTPIIV